MAMTGNEVSLSSEMRRYSIELKLIFFFLKIGPVGLPGLSVDGPKGHIGDGGYQGTVYNTQGFHFQKREFFSLKQRQN